MPKASDDFTELEEGVDRDFREFMILRDQYSALLLSVPRRGGAPAAAAASAAAAPSTPRGGSLPPFHGAATPMPAGGGATPGFSPAPRPPPGAIPIGTGPYEWNSTSQETRRQLDANLAPMVGMLDTIGGDVELLRASVQRMTENPESFGDLQVVEVNRRRDVVRQFTAKLGRCRTDLTDWQRLKADRTQALQLAAARGASAARGGPGGGPSDPGSSYVGDMVEQQREQQAALRADQDQALVRIHAGIETATDKARRIDAKLDEQHKKLTAVDQAMDSVNDKLKKVTRSVNKLIDESSDTSKYICIGVLIFILVLLLAYLFGGSSSSGSSSS